LEGEMKQKGCPFKNKCGAYRMKELLGTQKEKEFIKDHCESGNQKGWEECVHYQMREKSKKKNEDLFSSE